MKKSYTIKITLIACFAMCIGLSSCQWHTIEPIIPDVIVETVSFSSEIQIIFDDNCNSCHNNKNPILTNDVSYNNLINGNFVNTVEPENSVILTTISDGHFASYSIAEETLILTWIQQGAENN